MALKHILIAVPTMGGLVKAKTTTTLVLLMRQLTRAGVEAEYLNIDASDIVYARNFFACEVLRSKTLDGLLFVDSDMQFRPALVLKMLQRDVDVAAAAYPKRLLDLGRFSSAVARTGAVSTQAAAQALASAYQYTIIPSWESPKLDQIKVDRGFARMAAVGMGCTLISRNALRAMIDAQVVRPRKDILNGVEQRGWGFFDHLTVQDVTLSEDYSFCYRWTQLLGRELWVNVDEAVSHLGDFAYQGRFVDRLAGSAARASAPPAIDLEGQAVVDAKA
jgi:hypothetical protein